MCLLVKNILDFDNGALRKHAFHVGEQIHESRFYERQGPAHEVLCIAEIPDPQPGPGEVRVRVHVSGLNPTDLKARTGFSSAMPFTRIIPHQDGAGVIDAVGDPKEASRVGQRVWVYEAQYGRPAGTAADYVVVPSAQAVPLPDNVSFEVGASLGIPALTAHRCLFADGDIRSRNVLVQAGAGVVGTAAILLAKWAGAWVAATVRNEEQAAVARAAGADLVLNRLNEDVAAVVKARTGNTGVDRIVDVNVKANLDIDIACLAPGGHQFLRDDACHRCAHLAAVKRDGAWMRAALRVYLFGTRGGENRRD
ncbi:unnamed protein product, partial [Mesorhabditis spiculigera]